MNFKHLYYFRRVAKVGGIASEQLHLTPQTISGQIGLLEDDLGAPLFAKRGRNLELTDGRCPVARVSSAMASIRHRALARRRHQPGVLRQYAARVARCGRLPGFASARELFVGYVELEQTRISINGDGIAFLHQSDISSHRSFGRDVAHHHAVGAAGRCPCAYMGLFHGRITSCPKGYRPCRP